MMSPSAVNSALLTAVLVGCGSPPKTALQNDAAPADAAPEFDAGPPALADITVFRERMLTDISEDVENFEVNSCELDPDENCIGAPGLRRLLRFSVETPNIGDADLFLGSPTADSGDYVFSSCHGHFHFLGYAAYRLVDDTGADVATAQKQAFCLVDSRPFVEGDTPQTARFSCVFQGIQRGWSDVYGSELPCQYIDITDVAPGEYTLMVDINTEGRLMESDMSNNHAEIQVTVGNPDHETPTEACDTSLPPLAIENTTRECGYTLNETIDCTPGQRLRIGCAANCSLGSCTGDPMMRICDAATGNCSNAAALGSSDNACASECPETGNVECPASGQLAVYTAPKSPTASATCTVAWEVQ